MARPKGQPKLGGRRRGTPNKLTASVKEALEIAFNGLGGPQGLLEWARDNTGDFYRLWIKMLPKDLNVTMQDKGTDLSAEVRQRLDEVDGPIPGLAGEARSGHAADVADASTS